MKPYNIKDQQRLPWANIGQKSDRLEETLKPLLPIDAVFLKNK